jgi:hypothetical protein
MDNGKSRIWECDDALRCRLFCPALSCRRNWASAVGALIAVWRHHLIIHLIYQLASTNLFQPIGNESSVFVGRILVNGEAYILILSLMIDAPLEMHSTKYFLIYLFHCQIQRLYATFLNDKGWHGYWVKKKKGRRQKIIGFNY